MRLGGVTGGQWTLEFYGRRQVVCMSCASRVCAVECLHEARGGAGGVASSQFQCLDVSNKNA